MVDFPVPHEPIIDCIHSISHNAVTIESTAMLEGRSETNYAHGYWFDSLVAIHKHLSTESLYERYPVGAI